MALDHGKDKERLEALKEQSNGFTTKDLVLLLREDVKEIRADHEARLRELERRSWRFPASVLTSLAAVASALVVAFINHS